MPLQIGSQLFEWGSRTYLMGILNVTPDSFSGDGLMPSVLSAREGLDRALAQAGAFLAAGADILDIGGESTRPGSNVVEAEEELERVIPVISAIAREYPSAVISVDTYKARVAAEALSAGAHIVNDVWGLRADSDLAAVVAKNQAPVILMHNRSTPANARIQEKLGGRYEGMHYTDLVADVCAELMESVSLARQAGLSEDKIILDPGIGFGKTTQQNLELVNRLADIRALGFPILLGPSRKSFIGYTLNLPPDQRIEGTAAAVAVGIARGADIIRVHDVAVMARVVRMTDAMVRPAAHSA